MEKEIKVNLAGFNSLEDDMRSIAKRVVNNFVRKANQHHENIDELSITLKEVHKTKKNAKYELKGKINVNGKIHNAEAVDHNLFIALRDVLNRLHPKEEN